MKNKLIFGGGGGSSKSPHTAGDNLRSEDNAEILLGLCEGPIVGLENGNKSFYINDTPLLSADGATKNFDDFTLEIKNGDASQNEKIKFTQGGTAKGHNVGLEIKKSTGEESYITRKTDSANIDYIDVRIGIGALYESTKDGSVKEAKGEFTIQYKKSTASGWTTYGGGSLYVSGKTTSTYYKDYRISVNRDETDGVYYEVKVKRASIESSTKSFGYFFTLYFVQYEEVDAKVKEFKNTALAHLNIRTSDQVTSIPSMYGIYKLLKVKVPSNYNPDNHTYNGLWDGTFKIAWTDNPAWCLYDLIVNDRYGVNAYYPVTPDKWDFYEAGKYCDEMVDNGAGGREPRYTFNYLMTESQSGPEMLNQIASTFNAIIYEDSMGLVRLSYQDNEKAAVQLYNPANITSEGFSYSFSDPSTRYNDFTVTFLNPKLNWEEDRRRVTTPYGNENINSFGRIPYDFNALGCTKESEALRKARFMLITSLKETMTVSFSTNRSAMNVNLFDTILVADPDMGYSQTGRIKSISGDRSTVYLRDSVFLESGRSVYEFQIQTSYNIFRCNVINNEWGKVRELKLDSSLPDNIDEKAVFSLVAPTVVDEVGNESVSIYGSPKPFRVMSISEDQGDPDHITITALEIHRLKQEEADNNIELESEDYYTAPNINVIPYPKDANFNEYFNTKRLENALQIGVDLPWESYPYYRGDFLVYSRKADDEDTNFYLETLEDGDIIYGHAPGLYQFKILPYNVMGNVPPLTEAPIFEFEISEVAATPPADVSNFLATGNVENIHLTWNKVEDAVRYEIRMGKNWDTADIIDSNVLPSSKPVEEYFYTQVDTDNEYPFLIKAVNVAELYSKYAALAYGKLSSPADVRKFYITPNLDSLRFDWDSDNENYVQFEVRTGAEDWDSATKLFVASGNNQTILNPGFNSDTYFFIKSISRKGIYSQNALWGKIKQTLKQNRNVVLKVDNAAGELDYFVDSSREESRTLTPWYGVSKGLADQIYEEGEVSEVVKVMLDGYANAEHFFPVTFDETIIARNWYETEFFRFGTRLKWEDLLWAWNSEEANTTSWLNNTEAIGLGGSIDAYITTAKLPSDYDNYLGLRFNNTTSDISGTITPSSSYKIEYIDGKYDVGLAIYKAMKLNYTLVDFSPTFSLRFKIYLNPSIPNYMKFIRLSDNSMTNYIDVYFEDSNIKVMRSDGVSLSDPFENKSYIDYMFVMLTQSGNKLYLDYFIEYANIQKRLEVNCQPLTTFTKLYFGGRYD